MDPIQVVEAFSKAWDDHDMEATLELVTEDCVFDNTGPAPDGTRFVGKAAIRTAWQPIFDDPDANFEVEERFVAGERIVQLWRYNWNGGHVRGIDVFRIRDGKVAEKLAYVKG